MKKLTLMIVAAVAVVISIGVLTAGAVTSKPLVAVQLDEFSVFPATQGAPVGKVRFVVTNVGRGEHEFVVLKTSKPAGNLLGGDHGPNQADESGSVGEIGSVKAGEAKTVTLTLKRGHYSLICNLPGHYKTGQFADFYVR